jgi:signal transduction histidine kinase
MPLLFTTLNIYLSIRAGYKIKHARSFLRFLLKLLFHGFKKQPPAAELLDWRIVMLNQNETDALVRQMAERIKELERFESLVKLAGTMAHDFNNLLGGIYGYVDLARDNCSDEKIKTYLEKTVTTIERMRTLTQHLSSLSNGKIPEELLNQE